jgi:hypothetical protein
VKAAVKPTRLINLTATAVVTAYIKLTVFGANQANIGLQAGYKPKEYYKRVTNYLTQ